jgi:hypothetical protein
VDSRLEATGSGGGDNAEDADSRYRFRMTRWRYGVEILEDGTYVDRPRPTRGMRAYVSLPIWIVLGAVLAGLRYLFFEPSPLDLLLTFIALPGIWIVGRTAGGDASRSEYRLRPDALVVLHANLVMHLPYSRIVSLERRHFYAFSFGARWKDVLLVRLERKGRLKRPFPLTPTDVDEFERALRQRLSTTPAPSIR